MQEIRPDESEYRVTRRVVVHHIRPSTLFGRVLAFVFGILLLAATFFFSLVFFAILLTAVLFFLAYAWWLSRRMTRQGKTIEVEGDEEREEASGWHHEIDKWKDLPRQDRGNR